MNIIIGSTLMKYVMLLKDDQGFVPHTVHVGVIQDGLYFVLLSQVGLAGCSNFLRFMVVDL